MELLKPDLAMLDELDSGLDVDALHIVARAINRMREEYPLSLIVVSHYERFYELIEPQFVHVLVDGRIVAEGDAELARRIDTEGYDWIYKETGIQPSKTAAEKKAKVSLGSCAVSQKVQARK